MLIPWALSSGVRVCWSGRFVTSLCFWLVTSVMAVSKSMAVWLGLVSPLTRASSFFVVVFGIQFQGERLVLEVV